MYESSCDITTFISRENTPGNTKESVSSNEECFYNPDLDSFPLHSSHDNSNNNTSHPHHHVSAGTNSNTQLGDSSLSETPQSSDITNRSKKSKLRLTRSSDPSLPPVVILQTNQASQPAETAGFTFGFEVS